MIECKGVLLELCVEVLALLVVVRGFIIIKLCDEYFSSMSSSCLVRIIVFVLLLFENIFDIFVTSCLACIILCWYFVLQLVYMLCSLESYDQNSSIHSEKVSVASTNNLTIRLFKISGEMQDKQRKNTNDEVCDLCGNPTPV